MKLTRMFLMIVAAYSVGNAGAATLYFDSVDGTKDSSGYYVGPYSGRLDTTTYALFCDDFDHNINIPDTVQVNVSTIANLTLTRFGGLAAATSLYEKVFYLSSFLPTANTTDRGNIQDAMWSYFAKDAPNQTSTAVKGWETIASSNYSGKDYSNFRILTDSGNQAGGKQELFINVAKVTIPGLTGTPEPGTWALLLTGLGGFAFRRFRQNRT